METRGAATARNNRVCFRTTRATYWWLDELARERGWSRSTLVYWLVERGLSEVANRGSANLVAYIEEGLGDAGIARVRKDVDKGLSALRAFDVPW